MGPIHSLPPTIPADEPHIAHFPLVNTLGKRGGTHNFGLFPSDDPRLNPQHISVEQPDAEHVDDKEDDQDECGLFDDSSSGSDMDESESEDEMPEEPITDETAAPTPPTKNQEGYTEHYHPVLKPSHQLNRLKECRS